MYSNNTAAATTIIGESSFLDSLSIADGFSDSKKKILWYIKVMQQAGLEELSKVLKISRMAVHKHLNILLKKGFVEPIHIREGNVGRPKIFYQLTRNSKTIFPRSYSIIASSAFDYIEKRMGKEGIMDLLGERQAQLFLQYNQRLNSLEFEDKIKELAKIRDEEGYIAESKKINKKDQRNGTYELLEYNCPILQVAEKHWEACVIETELFKKILDGEIETSHTAAKGDAICRFIIKPNKQEFL